MPAYNTSMANNGPSGSARRGGDRRAQQGGAPQHVATSRPLRGGLGSHQSLASIEDLYGMLPTANDGMGMGMGAHHGALSHPLPFMMADSSSISGGGSGGLSFAGEQPIINSPAGASNSMMMMGDAIHNNTSSSSRPAHEERDVERARECLVEWLEEDPNNSFALHHMGMLLEEVARNTKNATPNAASKNSNGNGRRKRQHNADKGCDDNHNHNANNTDNNNEVAPAAEEARGDATPQSNTLSNPTGNADGGSEEAPSATHHDGGFLEARQYYKRAMAANPNNIDALVSLAYSLSRGSEEDKVEALALYEQGMELSKRMGAKPRPRLLKNYGLLLEEAARRDEAIAVLLNCTKLDKSNASVLITLGDMHDHDPKVALMYYDLARSSDPDNNLCHSKLGNLHEKMGNLMAAAECYQMAISVDPTQFKQWFQLGRTLETYFALSFVEKFPLVPPIRVYFDASHAVEPVPKEAVHTIRGFPHLLLSWGCYRHAIKLAQSQGVAERAGPLYRRKRALDKRFPWLSNEAAPEPEAIVPSLCSASSALSSAPTRSTAGLFNYPHHHHHHSSSHHRHRRHHHHHHGTATSEGSQLHGLTAHNLRERGEEEGAGTRQRGGKRRTGSSSSGASSSGSSSSSSCSSRSSADSYALEDKHCLSTPDSAGGVLCIRGHTMALVKRKPKCYARLATWACEECHLSIGREERSRYGTYFCVVCKYDLCHECSLKPRASHFYADPPIVIGSGGMGRVLRAFDPNLGTYAAVKVIFGAKKMTLEHEVRTMKLCRDPNVVVVYKSNPLADDPAYQSHGSFAMELMGGSLQDVLAVMGPQHENIVRQWMCDALCALVALRSRRIFHRDIKPANILLCVQNMFAPPRSRAAAKGGRCALNRTKTASRADLSSLDQTQQYQQKKTPIHSPVQANNNKNNTSFGSGGSFAAALRSSASTTAAAQPFEEYPPLLPRHQGGGGGDDSNGNNSGGIVGALIDRERAYAMATDPTRVCVARRAKLADFGICAEADTLMSGALLGGGGGGSNSTAASTNGGRGDTRHTSYAGTDYYAAPECMDVCDPRVNYRSDMWSLGMAWHALLTGSSAKPQRDDDEKKLVRFDFPVSSDCRQIISRMLSYDSTKRPSAKELLNAPYFARMRTARSDERRRECVREGDLEGEATLPPRPTTPTAARRCHLAAEEERRLLEGTASCRNSIQEVLCEAEGVLGKGEGDGGEEYDDPPLIVLAEGVETIAAYKTRLDRWLHAKAVGASDGAGGGPALAEETCIGGGRAAAAASTLMGASEGGGGGPSPFVSDDGYCSQLPNPSSSDDDADDAASGRSGHCGSERDDDDDGSASYYSSSASSSSSEDGWCSSSMDADEDDDEDEAAEGEGGAEGPPPRGGGGGTAAAAADGRSEASPCPPLVREDTLAAGGVGYTNDTAFIGSALNSKGDPSWAASSVGSSTTTNNTNINASRHYPASRGAGRGGSVASSIGAITTAQGGGGGWGGRGGHSASTSVTTSAHQTPSIMLSPQIDLSGAGGASVFSAPAQLAAGGGGAGTLVNFTPTSENGPPSATLTFAAAAQQHEHNDEHNGAAEDQQQWRLIEQQQLTIQQQAAEIAALKRRVEMLELRNDALTLQNNELRRVVYPDHDYDGTNRGGEGAYYSRQDDVYAFDAGGGGGGGGAAYQ